MPLHCPHCQIVQAEGNKSCINCGESLTTAPPAPPPADAPVPAGLPLMNPALVAQAAAAAHPADHDNPVLTDPVPAVQAVQAQQASWRLPALIAVGLLLVLAASALLVARHRPLTRTPLAAPVQAQTPDTASPAPLTVSPAPPPAAPPVPQVAATLVTGTKPVAAKVAAPPLTVTLASTGAGRHIKVGDAVTFTAFTTLEHGHSATLTLFARRGRSPRAMFAFVQGSLCSTLWTAPSPGRYTFTATALGDRHQTAASGRVEITVDKPAAPRVASEAARQAPPRAVPPRTTASKSAPPKRTPRPKPLAPVSTYYVAAAQFFYPRSADVLAAALSHRGYKAVPERMTDAHGKAVYVVVTGSYRRPSEARSAALALQRSGYPAYFFGGR